MLLDKNGNIVHLVEGQNSHWVIPTEYLWYSYSMSTKYICINKENYLHWLGNKAKRVHL